VCLRIDQGVAVRMLALALWAQAGCVTPKLEPARPCHVVRAQNLQPSGLSCFDVPRGEFRGVLWPSRSNPHFSLWVIRSTGFGPFEGTEETYVKSLAPGEPADWKERYEHPWLLRLVSGTPTRYLLSETGSNRALELELPPSDVPLIFSIVASGDRQFLVFLNPEELKIKKGLFGFVQLVGGAG
jgi:hypothetical protein